MQPQAGLVLGGLPVVDMAEEPLALQIGTDVLAAEVPALVRPVGAAEGLGVERSSPSRGPSTAIKR